MLASLADICSDCWLRANAWLQEGGQGGEYIRISACILIGFAVQQRDCRVVTDERKMHAWW
jgi:hypothetical protein